MEFALLGTSVTVPDSILESERLFRRYDEVGETAARGLDALRDQALQDRDSALEIAENYCTDQIRRAAESFVDSCTSLDVFDYNLDLVLSTYNQLGCGAALASVIDGIAQEISDAHAKVEQDAAYRSERRAGRARLVGGGFGLGGAAKGIAEAGAINAVTGAAHGLANLAGNLASRGQAATEISEALKKGWPELATALRQAICDFYGVHVNVLGPRGLCHADTLPERNARIKQASVMFEHVRVGKISPEKQIEVATRCLLLDPAGTDYLVFFCRQSLGTQTSKQQVAELARLAEAAGVDFRPIAARAFDSYYLLSKPETDRLTLAAHLRDAAEALGYDNTDHSHRIVAADFVDEAVRLGAKGFRDQASRLSAMLDDTAAVLPISTEGVRRTLAQLHGNALRPLAKEIVLDALDGDKRYLAASATPAFSAIMDAFDRTDVVSFFGNSKIDTLKSSLLSGTLSREQAETSVKLFKLLAPMIYKDATSQVSQVERYQAEIAARETPQNEALGIAIAAACGAIAVDKILVGDRISEALLGKARQSFSVPPDEAVFAVLDDPQLIGGTKGFALGASGIYWPNSRMPWREFRSVKISHGAKHVSLGAAQLPLNKAASERVAAMLIALQDQLRSVVEFPPTKMKSTTPSPSAAPRPTPPADPPSKPDDPAAAGPAQGQKSVRRAKSKVIAGFLAIFLGWIGVHRFYLGTWGLGLVYIMIFLVGVASETFWFVTFLLGLAEGARFLLMKRPNFEARYNSKKVSAFTF